MCKGKGRAELRRVATREESGVLGFPSRRGLTPRGSLECNPDAREVRFLCAWLGGARHCSRVMVGESHLKTR